MEDKNSKKSTIGKDCGTGLCRLRVMFCKDYLYRKRLMLIFGVFSKGTVTTSALLIWL